MTLTTEAAEEIIAGCVERAGRLGRTIGVAVVDADGAVLCSRRSPDVRSLTLRLATAKAYTAAVMEMPTRALEDWQRTRPVLLLQLSRLSPHPVIPGDGGAPIRRDGELLGGVGLSGVPGGEDAICREVLGDLGYDTGFADRV